MSKKIKDLDFTIKEPLIDRQRRLWKYSETIEISQNFEKPLPINLSKWLHESLKKIACGADANEIFNVIPEKQGIRKNGFSLEINRKISNGFIAAATEEGAEKMKTTEAIKKISAAMPEIKESTVRKNYNKASTERKPTFTLGKK
jgi:hypothetical protein